MDLDLKGRINNTKLPLSNGLHPLFEAISNSIHAIEEAKATKGLIEVEVVRGATAALFGEEVPVNQPFLGFVVQDNGIGFTDANFKSFQTSDTTKKRTKGGKGVGRFLWLKAFDRIEVESVFEKKGKLYKRSFEFHLSDSGVEKEQVVEVTSTPRTTVVRLTGFKSEYRQHQTCPKSATTVARRIVEHFLESFILETCPTIRLRDEHEKTDINLNNLFKTEMRLDVQSKDFQVKSHKFHITHVRLLAPQDMTHSLSFCANNRLR